jgi:pimeloyl-ACP methyl ester carboxylesterase
VEGYRHAVTSADGTQIGLLTAGQGPPLLLVHGGMGCIASWRSLWDALTERWRVTAMDRRGRGSSGDSEPYDISREFEDVAAAAASLDGPADVFGHSFGATCALGAAAHGAPIRRLALYEPPGPQTAPREWRDRVRAMIAAGQPRPAMASFLTEVIGLTEQQVIDLRNAPRDYDVMPIVSATMPRESQVIADADLPALAASVPVPVPVLLILGSASPAWAHDITGELAARLPDSTLAVLDGQGHDAIDSAPELLASELAGFFRYR